MSTDIEPTSTIVEIAPEITAVFGDIPLTSDYCPSLTGRSSLPH